MTKDLFRHIIDDDLLGYLDDEYFTLLFRLGNGEEFRKFIKEKTKVLPDRAAVPFLDWCMARLEKNAEKADSQGLKEGFEGKKLTIEALKGKWLKKHPAFLSELPKPSPATPEPKPLPDFETLFQNDAQMITAIEAAKETGLINGNEKWIAKGKQRSISCFWWAVKMANFQSSNAPGDGKAGQIIAERFGTKLGKNALTKSTFKSEIEQDDLFRALLAYMKGKKGS